jgi:NAD(P)-dependent dehydrogenase (short-subunit alcohol dehydrogenase family)
MRAFRSSRRSRSFAFADWKRVLAIHLDGAFLSTRAALRQMYKQGSGSIIYMGSVHSKEASLLKAPYVTAKHGLMGLAKVVAKEGAKHGVRANVICPGFVRTPLVDKQIPEQAKDARDIGGGGRRDVMLKDTVDGEFTTVRTSPKLRLFFASFESNAIDRSIADRQPWLVHAVTRRSSAITTRSICRCLVHLSTRQGQSLNSAHGETPERCHLRCARRVERVGFIGRPGMYWPHIASIHDLQSCRVEQGE